MNVLFWFVFSFLFYYWLYNLVVLQLILFENVKFFFFFFKKTTIIKLIKNVKFNFKKLYDQVPFLLILPNITVKIGNISISKFNR